MYSVHVWCIKWVFHVHTQCMWFVVIIMPVYLVCCNNMHWIILWRFILKIDVHQICRESMEFLVCDDCSRMWSNTAQNTTIIFIQLEHFTLSQPRLASFLLLPAWFTGILCMVLVGWQSCICLNINFVFGYPCLSVLFMCSYKCSLEQFLLVEISIYWDSSVNILPCVTSRISSSRICTNIVRLI